MRGLVLKESTVRWRFLKAAAVVLVSGVDDLYKESSASTSHAPPSSEVLSRRPSEDGDEKLLEWLPQEVIEHLTAGPTGEELEKIIGALEVEYSASVGSKFLIESEEHSGSLALENSNALSVSEEGLEAIDTEVSESYESAIQARDQNLFNHSYPDFVMKEDSNDTGSLLHDPLINFPYLNIDPCLARLGDSEEQMSSGTKRSWSSVEEERLPKKALLMLSADPMLSRSHDDIDEAIVNPGFESSESSILFPGMSSSSSATEESFGRIDDDADCCVKALNTPLTNFTTSTNNPNLPPGSPTFSNETALLNHCEMWTSQEGADVGGGTLGERRGAVTMQHGNVRAESVTPEPKETVAILRDHTYSAQQLHNFENSNVATPIVCTVEDDSVVKTSPLIMDCVPTTSTETDRSIASPECASGSAQSIVEQSVIIRMGEEGQLYKSFVRADEVLRTAEHPEHIPVLPSGKNKHFACHDAVYLEPWWIFTQLIRPRIGLNRFQELQTAFELYGYDNLNVEDVFGRALDLARVVFEEAHSLKHSQLTDQVLRMKPTCGTRNRHALAVEIVTDAFFRGRSLRPDLKTYLSKKVMLQGNETFVLPLAKGFLRTATGPYSLQKRYWAAFRKQTESCTESSYPFSFDQFCHDVTYFIKNITKPELLTTLRSKYHRVFGVDILAQLTAVMNTAPTATGTEWFELAIRKGYIPPRRAPLPTAMKGSLSVQCFAGAVANLYMSLFENLQDRAEDLDCKRIEAITDPVRRFLMMPIASIPATPREPACDASPLLMTVETFLKLADNKTSRTAPTTNFKLPQHLLKHLSEYLTAPFGSLGWVLSQLLLPHCPKTARYWFRPGELQCAFDRIGLVSVDVDAIATRALKLATDLLNSEECSSSIEQPGLTTRLQPHMLAAKIIHSAFFRNISQHQDQVQRFQERIRYEVLPEHKRCLRRISTLRHQLYSGMKLRSVKGHTEVESDWSVFLRAIDNMPQEEHEYPLSFREFIADLQTVTASTSHWRAAIISKYKTLFDRDILKDFTRIRALAPDVTEGNSFIDGIADGFVPYSFASMLTLTRQNSLVINRNALHLAGAVVTYYRSLLGVEQTSDGAGAGQLDDEFWEYDVSLMPRSEESDHWLLHGIFSQAPPQERLIPPATDATPAQLSPVAHFLLHNCLPAGDDPTIKRNES
eukprot:Blabericola_migrator_1__8650@NODE_453_length_8332_cov_11_679492_g355_i0_p2_GENE_NODE_453_length_8332_cov_11_679492_g355_i0NODE_453_length_8332_cov_11_679492_g355_i0_p2_ORF_typecomplete_len1176_score159_82_NODE_453_length_8332_cov_11_679492_g355_i02323759